MSPRDDYASAGRRIRWIGETLAQIGQRMEADERVDPAPIDTAVAQLKGVRARAFGRRRTGAGSARGRLRAYLVENVGVELPGEELAEVAGISEWARRLRELREEGLAISQPAVGVYRLEELP